MAANGHPELTAQLERNRADREKLLDQRDELVRAAAAAGMKKTHIAEAVGLSAMQVHRLIQSGVERDGI